MQVSPVPNYTTNIVQTRIFLVGSAVAEFNRSSAEAIVLVTIPVPSQFVYFCLTIPSGVTVLSQSFLRHDQVLPPGPLLCWPAWNRVSHVVNRAALSYNCAVYQVPTADNIMINILLSITFQISDPDNAVRFVYSMGSRCFGSFLKAKSDDAIRGLVRCVTHDKLNDLRSEFCDGMTRNLNYNCQKYGVRILGVKILSADLPQELQDRLEKTTSFKTRIEEEEKAQENRKRVWKDDAEQKLTAIIKSNQRKIQELTAECVKFEIHMTEMQAASRGGSQVAEVQARSNMDIAITKAKGALSSSSARGLQESEDIVRQASASSQLNRSKVEQEYIIQVAASEGRLGSTRRMAQAMIATAEAEMSGAKNLEVKRKTEIEWERLESLKELTAHRRILISGEDGMAIVKKVLSIQK